MLSDTDGLAWIIFQLPHVSLFVCDKKSEGKRDVFIMVSQHGVQLIQLSMKLSWHIQAPDNKIFRAESVTFTDFYVLPTEKIGKLQ